MLLLAECFYQQSADNGACAGEGHKHQSERHEEDAHNTSCAAGFCVGGICPLRGQLDFEGTEETYRKEYQHCEENEVEYRTGGNLV